MLEALGKSYALLSASAQALEIFPAVICKLSNLGARIYVGPIYIGQHELACDPVMKHHQSDIGCTRVATQIERTNPFP